MLVHLGVKVPAEIKQRIEDEAAKERRSVSSWVYLKLEAVLQQESLFHEPTQELPRRSPRRRTAA